MVLERVSIWSGRALCHSGLCSTRKQAILSPMQNFFYTDPKGQKHLLTPPQVKKLSRRDFLRATFAGLLGVTGCAQSRTAPSLEQADSESVIELVEQPTPQPVPVIEQPPAPQPAPAPAQQQQPAPRTQRSPFGAIERLDPILVGRNIVMDPQWLNFVGDGRQLTRQQFQAWVSRLDCVYDAMEDLVGSKPTRGDTIFVALRPASSFQRPTIAGTGGNGIINVNREHGIRDQFFRDISSNGITRLLPHEMAHIFAQNKQWEISQETTAEFIKAYVLESLAAHFGVLEFRHGATTNTFNTMAFTRGSQHRKRGFDIAYRGFRNNTLSPISPSYGNHNSVHAFYLFGLVDVVGWEPYRQAFRSYLPESGFIPRYIYRGPQGGRAPTREAARDLFDRIAHFHEVARTSNDPAVLRTVPPNARNITYEQVLRSLPDRGRLLETHLNVTKTPNPRAQQTAQQAQPIIQMRHVEPIQTPASPPRRVFVNENYIER